MTGLTLDSHMISFQVSNLFTYGVRTVLGNFNYYLASSSRRQCQEFGSDYYYYLIFGK